MTTKSLGFLFIIIFLSIFFSCDPDDDINPSEPNPIDTIIPIDSTPIHFSYLALGDSYTIGQSVVETGRYPVILADSLVSDGFENDTTIIIAQTGWTTANLIQTIDQANIQDIFSMVSLLIGVNNQFQGRSIEEYEIEFRELLVTAIQFAGGDKDKVFIISIPDYAYTPFGLGRDTASISAGVDAFNALNKSVAEEMTIRYFDITPISRMGLDQPDLVATDNLHPSAKMYGEWVKFMYDDVKQLLKQ